MTEPKQKMFDVWTITCVCGVLSLALFSGFAVYIHKLGLPNNLNEIGDAVAGFSNALALIWLVGGYLMQQEELRQTRKEYQNMRQNSEAQTKLATRNETVNGCQIYISSLESALTNLENHQGIILKNVLSKDISSVPRYYVTGVFISSLRQIEHKNKTDEMRKIEKYREYISKEANRFVSVYTDLLYFLDNSEHGDWVRKALIDNSIHADIYDLLKEASWQDGIVRDFFKRSRDDKHA